MNLETAKKMIRDKVGISHTFLYRGVRNQIEEFSGKITKCFPSVFLIETDQHVIKSFTYSDFIIKNLKIIS